MRRLLLLLVAFTATALFVSACDDDGGGGDTTTDEATDEFTDPVTDEDTGLDDTTGTGEPPAEGTATVQVAADQDILVNSEGFALYVFDNDMGTTSACTGGCLDTWPPLTVAAEPIAGEGVDGALLNTAEQADGTVQVTYNDHLLYTFSGDTAPGETNGDGIGGVWHVIDAAGNPVT